MLEKRNVPAVVRFGPFILDGRTGELRNGQIRLKVPDQSISILQALLEHPGELVSREALRDRLWGPDTFVDFEAGLNAAGRRLREALNDSADTPRYVETLPRRGYRFIGPVDVVSTGLIAAQSGIAPADTAAAAPAEPVQGRRLRGRSVVLTLVALALLGAALWAALRRSDTAAPTESAARPVPITRFPGLELEPALSPTGNFVAFAWDGKNEDNFDIYVRSIDGTQQRQLTSDASPDHAPAWSPDGLHIAFVRVVPGRRVIVKIPAFGGPEQRLFETAVPEHRDWFFGDWSYGLSWTPDGRHLVFGDGNTTGFTSAIYLYSLEDGQRRQLTRPPANLGDTNPVVSPDGRYLAFVRLNLYDRGGSVFVQKLEHLQPSGEPTPLTFAHDVTGFDWTADSRSIIHNAGNVDPGMWRTSVPGGASELVSRSDLLVASPSVARSGAGVVYQTTAFDSNIWELRAPSAANRQPTKDESFRVIASTSADTDMRISPDGTRIAFVSRRSGNSELWVSNRDGSQERQLTNFKGWRPGSPCWSFDGRSIAFDAIAPGGTIGLYDVAADGNPIVRTVLSDTYTNARPSWSLDGRSIYFGSNRKGRWQIWKMPSAGGTPVQITRGGGMDSIVSPDGRHLYYAKPPPVEGIWEVPLDGGQEIKIVERGKSLSFDVADPGIFIMDLSKKTIEMFSFASRKIVPVAGVSAGGRFFGVPYFNVTRDGRSMLYTQFDSWTSDIEMLPGVR